MVLVPVNVQCFVLGCSFISSALPGLFPLQLSSSGVRLDFPSSFVIH